MNYIDSKWLLVLVGTFFVGMVHSTNFGLVAWHEVGTMWMIQLPIIAVGLYSIKRMMRL